MVGVAGLHVGQSCSTACSTLPLQSIICASTGDQLVPYACCRCDGCYQKADMGLFPTHSCLGDQGRALLQQHILPIWLYHVLYAPFVHQPTLKHSCAVLWSVPTSLLPNTDPEDSMDCCGLVVNKSCCCYGFILQVVQLPQ